MNTINWAALNSRLVLVKVHEVTRSAVRADVIVLDGDDAGTEYNDTLIFPKVLQSQVKSKVGSMVLGRLGQGEAKKGQSAPWVFAATTATDAAIARAYLAKTVL